MVVPYTPENAVRFHAACEKWIENFQTYPYPVVDLSGPIKKLGKNDNADRPFSILQMRNPALKKNVYYVISNMGIGEPGTFGHIKIAYPLLLTEPQMATIQFNNPMALKIMRHPALQKETNTLITQAARTYMREEFSDFAEITRPTLSKKQINTNPEAMRAGFKYYYILPLYNSCDLLKYLNERLVAQQLLTAEEIFTIFYNIAKQLKLLHDKRTVHRDLKLENIIIFPDLNVRIIDLDSINFEGTALAPGGTREYMSPELTQDSVSPETKLAISFAQDIFAFGRTLGFCLEAGINKAEGKEFYFLHNLVNRTMAVKPTDRPSINEILRRFQEKQLTLFPNYQNVPFNNPALVILEALSFRVRLPVQPVNNVRSDEGQPDAKRADRAPFNSPPRPPLSPRQIPLAPSPHALQARTLFPQ